MDDAPVGTALPIQTVATTKTAADGSYSIELAPTPAMQKVAAGNGGWVNLEVGTAAVATTTRTETAGISRKVSGSTWDLTATTTDQSSSSSTTARRATAGDEDPAPTANALAPLDLVFSADSPTTTPGTPDSAVTRTALSRANPSYCSFIVTGRPKRATSVVEFHSASNSNGLWSYGKQADSDIDQGIDYSGDGGWTIGVTRHVANTTSSTAGRDHTGKVDNYGRTNFEFVDGYYKNTFGSGIGNCTGTSIPVGTKVKNPIEWFGGVSSSTKAGSEYFGCSSQPQKGNRSAYAPGSFHIRDANDAAEIGAALSIGPLQLGGKSGYSTRMYMTWQVKRGKGIWLCGTNYGVIHAGVVHAQNIP